MKCDVCGATRALKCSKCGIMVCRQHYSQCFDEDTRKLSLLCHSCSRKQVTAPYLQRRRWRRYRYRSI